MMVINNKYDLGQVLYLVTDPEQYKRVVTAIIVCPDGSYLYELAFGVNSSKHYDFELSTERDEAMKAIS